MSRCSRFELHLPVFKQGDDLLGQLEKNQGDPAKAFLGLAAQYEQAAAICRRVAGVSMETSLSVEGDTHMIFIEGSEEALGGLLEDGVLMEDPWEYEDPDEEEEEEAVEVIDG